MTPPVVRAPETDEEWRTCNRIAARAFNSPLTPESEQTWLEEAHRDRCLAVFVGDDVAAWAQVRPFGQFFGGRSVPMGGYSPVVATPEYRGRGFGSLITAAHFPLLRERGEILAGLYPAQTQLYRGTGFEIAGVFTHQELPTRSLHRLRPRADVRVRTPTLDDLPAIKDCYRRFASTHDGWLDRPDVWWDRRLVVAEKFAEQHLFVVDAASGSGADGQLAGYVRFSQRRARPFGYTIEVHELCADDPDVAIALWRLLGTSSTQAELVRVAGSTEHPLLLHLVDQDLKSRAEIRWMLRLVDAAGAIAARGFPRAVRASVDLDVVDRHCDWNNGSWRLVVADGEGRLERGGSRDVSLSINAFASLYSGYATASALRQNGLISSGSASDLADLTAMFAGPTPSIADFY